MQDKPVWLTKNEKKVLALLIQNARISDTDLAINLGISSQAAGQIRKKLEEEKIILGYSTELDIEKLNLNLAVLARIDLTSEGLKLGKEKVIEILKSQPNIVNIFEVIGGNFTYIFNGFFRNMNDFNQFVNSKENREGVQKYIKIIESYPIPISNIRKKDLKSLNNKALEDLGKY